HAGSPIYTVPLPLLIDANGRYTRTYKAKALLAGWVTSETATKAYTMIPTVPTPVITANFPGLVHATPIEVSITDALAGVQIYYTLDGSDPDETSIPYLGAFTLSTTTTVRTRAYKAGYKESLIEEITYIVGNNIGAIVFQPAAGTYLNPIDVTIITSQPDADIYYTTDGTDPQVVGGVPQGTTTLYLSPIHLGFSPTSVTIKALAVKENWTESRGSATYKVTDVLAAPTITPASSQYVVDTSVSVTITAPNGTIWYSVDGAAPQMYAVPFNVTRPTSGTITVTAWADVDDASWLTSPTSTAVYTFNGQLNAPIVTPVSGTYGSNVTVQMYNYQGATMYYSTDNGVTYNEYTFGIAGFVVDKNTTVMAYASKANWPDSPIVTNVYNLKVPNPVFDPLSNSFALPFAATLSVSSMDAIYYTLDGSNPTLDNVNAILYVNPIDVGYGYTRIRAMAHRADWISSEVVEVIYNVNGQLQMPVLSLASDLYYNPQTVTINANPINALVYYTTDGTEPDESSSLYGGAINITEITTLKAKAYLAGWLPSETANAIYDLKVKPITSDHLPDVYTTTQFVVLQTLTPNTDIYYTIDGGVPGLGSTLYTGAITVSSTTRIRARAYKNDGLNWLPSDEFDQSYGISQQVATPVFNLPGGVYNYAPVSVAITSTTPDATIWYAYEGEGWQNYTVPLQVNTTKVIYAKAEKNGWVPSPVVYAHYIISIPVVATPNFVEQAGTYFLPGTYNNAVDVSITSSTPGAQIYYTTDGSEPTEIPALLYSAPFTVSATTTVKAKAFKAGNTPSATLTGVYSIEPLTVLDPIVVPEDDTNPFYEPFFVFMYPRTTDSVIHYTTNGDEPTIASDTYAAPFLLNSSAVIKAKAFKNGFASNTVTRNYRITGKVNISGVTITPNPGYYTTLQTISTVGALNPIDAVLRYTTDGSNPTFASPLFNPLNPPLGSTLNLKIRGFKDDWLPSDDILSAYFTFTGQVVLAADLFSLDPAPIYTTPQSLTLNTLTTPPGATLRYTLNGNDPTELSPAYVAGYNIPITAATTVKVIAYLNNWLPSVIASATYQYTGQVVLGSISPNAGTYQNLQPITLGIPVPNDASVYYTTDGNDPTIASTQYNGNPFNIDANAVVNGSPDVTVKVKAFKDNWIASEVLSRVYTFQAATPQFNLSSGMYPTTQSVELTTNTIGGVIHYTLDGTDPVPTSPVYNVALLISESKTIKARAYNGDYLPSPITSATYVIGTNQLVALPTFTPDPSITYSTAQSVHINCATPGASIYYRTDGIDPTESD
ncbi:MAG: hypothetical protein CVV42_20775, partial [Candidatus Riflebacteria bacterium HGW-Riflebacteria-2]